MFHPYAQLRVLFVDGLLPFADFLALGVSFDHLVLHLELPHHSFHSLADICAIGKQILSSILLVHKVFHRFGIVDGHIGGHPFLDELATLVHFRVVLLRRFVFVCYRLSVRDN